MLADRLRGRLTKQRPTPRRSVGQVRQGPPTGDRKSCLAVFVKRKFRGKTMGFVTTKAMHMQQHYYLFCIPNGTMAGF